MDPIHLYSNYAIFAVFVCLLLTAAALDVTGFVIPNWVSLSVAVLFFIAAAVLPVDTAWASHLGAAAAVLMGGLVIYAMRILGGGDIKLITALSLWAGFEHLPMLLLYIALGGGIMALAPIVLRRVLLSVTIHVPAIEGLSRTRRAGDTRNLAYGVAIAAGSIVVALDLPHFTPIL